MSLYDFTDTTPTGATGETGTTGSALPAEALSINGTYIENVVTGYRTLTVSGRETMAQEIKEAEVGKHDGAFFQYRRYPTRDIVVKFQILAGSNSAYREAFIKLNKMLDFEEGKLIFNDEQDKYFIGTPTDVELPEPGLNSAVGEFTLHCEDPFKYSTTETTVNTTTSSGDTFFNVAYDGTHKSYPKINVNFYQTNTEDDSNGECAYVALATDTGNVLQFGDPENTNANTTPVRIFKRVVSEPSPPSSQIEYSFDTGSIVNTSALDNWTQDPSGGDTSIFLWTTKATATSTTQTAYIESTDWGPVEQYANQDDSSDYTSVLSKTEINKKWEAQGSDWVSNTGLLTTTNHLQTGSISIANDSTTNTKVTSVSDYGSGSKYHGPSVTRSISDNIKNWNFSFNYRFAEGSSSNAVKQNGQFQAMLWNSAANKIIAGIQMWKPSGSSLGTIRLWVGGKNVKELTSMKFSNSLLYSNSNLRIFKINKLGSTFVFRIRGKEYRFIDDMIESTEVDRCTFWFGVKGSGTPMTYNSVGPVQLEKSYQAVPPNPFTTNDKLQIDTKNTEVLLNNADAQYLGALANDWEGFYLKPGTQQIAVTWSDWVPSAYKPTFTLRYRKVYL